mmetsp:Transcript_21390/g.34844  ORF Transcript_21390/g.34844 Transcript_21390/m.34844 type:complete len:232 (-) Transcript_21390:2118-2813(-)
MIFRQLFDRESCTYTYLIGDEASRNAVLIDPVIEHVARDTKLLQELGFNLVYAMNTHVHADHITGSGKLKEIWERCQSVLGRAGNEDARADIKLADGEVLGFGKIQIKALHTPGHTAGCHCYYLEDGDSKYVFTGDTVLIRGCGRTDFQGGSSEALYRSVHEKIFSLSDDTILYSGHDYKGNTQSTVGEEKKHNPRLTQELNGFIDTMENLKLAHPAKIDIALPANLVCGI